MVKLSCASDIGSVLIGDQNWTVAVPNVGGDGETQIRIFDSLKEFFNSDWYGETRFVASVQGRFGIYDYDCAYHNLLSGDMSIEDALAILDGRYGVYNGDYKVAFVKWE